MNLDWSKLELITENTLLKLDALKVELKNDPLPKDMCRKCKGPRRNIKDEFLDIFMREYPAVDALRHMQNAALRQGFEFITRDELVRRQQLGRCIGQQSGGLGLYSGAAPYVYGGGI